MHLVILLLTGLFISPRTAQAISPLHTDTVSIDTARYSVLPFNKNRDAFLFDKEHAPAELSAAEIAKIEKITRIIVAEYNQKTITQRKAEAEKNNQTLTDAALNSLVIEQPTHYYKQLIAVTNSKNQKEVWVNCFCTPREKKYWRKGVVVVLDGGTCFFNLKINLSTNTVTEFTVNGVA